jgi:serine/threonine protein kinase
MILGTAAPYVAGAGARGAVDHRVDIWAFGVVLYEMLTGPEPSGRNTIADVLARWFEMSPNSTPCHRR